METTRSLFGFGPRSEDQLPSFDGATGWLNSEPLTPAELVGKVVLVVRRGSTVRVRQRA
jgi:hypothetical protein